MQRTPSYKKEEPQAEAYTYGDITYELPIQLKDILKFQMIHTLNEYKLYIEGIAPDTLQDRDIEGLCEKVQIPLFCSKDGYEQNAMAVNGARKSGGTCQKTSDDNNRYFEMFLSPERSLLQWMKALPRRSPLLWQMQMELPLKAQKISP